MFFRMIKKDLRDSKGLNIILMLFMIIVSTLASAGGLLQLENTRGIAVSRDRSNASDVFMLYEPRAEEVKAGPTRLQAAIKRLMPDSEVTWQPVIPISASNIDFTGKDAMGFQGMSTNYFLSALPKEMDLVYDDKNCPFYVENGHIAVTRQFARATGINAGDALCITTEMGRTYRFQVSVIAKDPTKEWETRFILSDADYDAISKECPHIMQFVYLQDNSLHMDSMYSGASSLYAFFRDLSKDKSLKEQIRVLVPDCHMHGNNAIISFIVFVFVMIACVFMFIIIVLTLGFSIRSAVKKQERELGIMKALGTDSLSFRWLFAAKYIAFAAVGGIIGCIVGIIAGRYLLDNFYYNIIFTLSPVDLIPSILASCMIILLVVLFIFISLRRIDKISVMDAINGDNRSESINHPGRFQMKLLHKMPVPLYLALTDLLSKFRRYAMLLVAFTAGSILVMYSIQLHDTMISPDFLHKYFTIGDIDFGIEPDTAFFEEMSSNTYRPDIAERNTNAKLQSNGIPAEVDYSMNTNANLCAEDGYISIVMYSGVQSDRLYIVKGGQPPLLPNEILIDHYTAVCHGYKIGDTVTIEYEKYDADKLSHSVARDKFVITGYIDEISKVNNINVIMSEDFHDAVTDYWDIVGFRIHAPESEKLGYMEQIAALFPDVYVDKLELGGNFLSMYDILFSFVRNVMIVVVSSVLAFLTVMYQTLFIKDEENETAMLKSCGFDDSSIKKCQFLRMLLLFGAAQVLAAVLMPTGVTWLNNIVIRRLLGLTNWEFTGSWIPCALWIVFVTVLVAAVDLIVLRGIEKIEIWRIRNE